MIALALLAAAPVQAMPPFAPPLDRVLRYRVTRWQPARPSDVRIVQEQRLRFAARAGGWTATVEDGAPAIEAPPQVAQALAIEFAPQAGLAVTASLDRSGTALAPIDDGVPRAALRASSAALAAHIATDASVAAGPKAAAAAALAAEQRDDRLTSALLNEVERLLPPPLPALRAGETRPFSSHVDSEDGPLAANGTVTWRGVTKDGIAVDLAIRTAPLPTTSTAAAMRAGLPADATPAARAKVEAAIAGLAGTTFVQTSRLLLDPDTGLVRHRETEIVLAHRDGTRSPVSTERVELLP